MNDSDVLGRARSGDERAFLALYRAAQPGLLRYLTVLVGEGAAELIAKQTWDQVGDGLANFTGTLDGFLEWVAGIGRGIAQQHLAVVPERPPSIQGTGPTPPRTARALQIIAELPRDEAEAVVLQSVMGLDETGAASVLGVRRGTVRRVALRGLRALARRLDPVMERPPAAEAAAPVVRNLRVMPGGQSGEAPLRPARVELEIGQGIEVSS